MASTSASAVNANAANGDPLRAKALETLRLLGAHSWNPSLSLESVIEATPTYLKVKFPAMEFVMPNGVSEVCIDDACQIVAMASFAVGDELSLNLNEVHHNNVYQHLETLPEQHEEIVITARVQKDAGSLPKTYYDAVVIRNNQKIGVISGSSVITTTDPSNTVQSSRNVPILPPIPSVQGKPLRSLTGFRNHKKLIQKPADPQPSTSGPVVSARPHSPIQLIRPIQHPRVWNPSSLTCYEIPQLVGEAPPTIRQQFMCMSFQPDRKYTYLELSDHLRRIRVTPQNVGFTELGFYGARTLVYYFDSENDAARTTLERNIFKEDTWFKHFAKERNRRAEYPFISRAMPLMEIFRTMVVATRLLADAASRTDRAQSIRDPAQIRRAIRHPRLVSMRGELGNNGMKMYRRLRKEVGL